MPLVSATVFRESLNTRLGLFLRQVDGRIMITGMDEKFGLFANTNLQVGMALVSINGMLCPTMSCKEAVKFLKSVKGDLTITAEHVGYVCAKVTKTESPFIGMAVKSRRGQIYITAICKDGLFADTNLKVGMQVVSVNKHHCGGLRTIEAVALFKDTSQQELVVLAKDPGYITVQVLKEYQDTPCGISVKEMNGDNYVSYIDPKGIFGDTDLKVGLKLVRVKHKELHGKTAAEALEILQQATGSITIYAEQAGFYHVKVFKETPSSKVGIKLRSQDGNIFVSSLTSDSLFTKTDLKAGFRIISVNGNAFRGMSPIQAIQYFIEAPRVVEVFAEDVAMTGSVQSLRGEI